MIFRSQTAWCPSGWRRVTGTSDSLLHHHQSPTSTHINNWEESNTSARTHGTMSGLVKNAAIYLTVTTIFAPICLVATALLVWRRDIQPIKARMPWLSGLSGLILAVHNIILGVEFSLADEPNCSLINLAGHMAYIGLAWIYLFRCWHLHIQHHTTGTVVYSVCVQSLGLLYLYCMSRHSQELNHSVAY